MVQLRLLSQIFSIKYKALKTKRLRSFHFEQLKLNLLSLATWEKGIIVSNEGGVLKLNERGCSKKNNPSGGTTIDTY